MTTTAKHLVPFVVVALAFACSQDHQSQPETGIWRATLATPGGELPFGLEIRLAEPTGDVSSSFIAYIINGEERIAVNDITVTGDSIFLRLPVFDSEIRAEIISRTLLMGRWVDYNRDNYSIPFRAEHGVKHRFGVSTPGERREERWEVTFSPDSSNEAKSIGIFHFDGDYVEGTFLTETGDYRYLEGMMRNDSLLLSCFDGAHAFLFKAKRTGNGMSGTFWSGTHFREEWVAVLNPDFKLRDADSLTFLKPGYERFEFAFPDPDDNMVSLDDFKGLVVIVQIMGSWCPNCMDEAVFFADAWREYHDRGLEIIGLAFEKTRDFKTARDRVLRMKEHLDIPYPILIAGFRNPREVEEKLPALNRLMSYPTSIFIDREGEVRRIHTGFNGPATGEVFLEFQRDFHELIQGLLADAPVGSL